MLAESPRSWYAIRVRLFHELKTKEKLEKMGVECFVPVRKELRVWHDRRVIKERVLTPQLIFLYATEEERIEALRLSAALFCVCVPGKSIPARIPEAQMQAFIFFITNANKEVDFTETPLREGDRVCIGGGALAGLQGVVVNNKGKHFFALKVEMLGCAIMEIEEEQIEKIGEE